MFLAAGAGFFPMAENKSVGEEVAVDGSEKKKVSLLAPEDTCILWHKKEKENGPILLPEMRIFSLQICGSKSFGA